MSARGFSLAEVVVSIGILLIVGTIGLSAFVSYDRKETLEMTAAKVESLLGEARSLTLASHDDAQYGVHFGQHEAVLFSGMSYSDSGESNQSFMFSDFVNITTDFSTGGSDIIFKRLTGATDTYGTTTLSTASLGGLTKNILIYKTGLIERD